MKRLLYIACAVLFALLGAQLYRSYAKSSALTDEVSRLAAEVAALKEENQKTEADLGYYADLENLAKELKAKFDYKRPGEILYKIQ